MKKTIYFFLLNIFFLSFANCSIKYPNMNKQTFHEIQNDQNMANTQPSPAILQSTRRLKAPVIVYGNFLYYQPKTDGLELGYYSEREVPPDYKPYTGVYLMDFDWDPGFEIGLGYKLDHGEWNLLANYMRFFSQSSHSVDRPLSTYIPGTFVPYWDQVDYDVALAQGKEAYHITNIWHLKMHVFLLSMQTETSINKKLSLFPTFSLKGGLINVNCEFI